MASRPSDARAAESYQAIATAINLARRDADAFGKSVEGVQGQLFRLRHGVDPQALARVFLNGGDAANALVANLREINSLVGRGEIGQAERLQLVREEANKAATDTAGAAPQPATGGRDWMRDLIEGIAGANRHVLIEGQSGSGKSLMTQEIAFQRAQRGEEVNVLDPHKPETWKGVKEVFTRDTAQDFAKVMLDTLRSREKQGIEAKARGETVDFKPVTFALSDFAAIAKEFPKVKDVIQTVLTEGRKFNIAVLAETAGFNAAEVGGGTAAMRRNFAQQLQMNAPGPGRPERTARIGGETFVTPDLSHTQGQVDPSIVRYKPTAPPPPPPEPEVKPFDPRVEATRRREAERRRAVVDAEYERQYGDTDRAGRVADQLLDLADQFRGALGGLGGVLVGSVLDVVGAVRRAQVEVVQKTRQHELLAEATSTIPSPRPAAAPAPTPVTTEAPPAAPQAAPSPAATAAQGSPAPAVAPQATVDQETPRTRAQRRFAELNPDQAQAPALPQVQLPPVVPPAPAQAPPTIPPAPAKAPPTVPPGPTTQPQVRPPQPPQVPPAATGAPQVPTTPRPTGGATQASPPAPATAEVAATGAAEAAAAGEGASAIGGLAAAAGPATVAIVAIGAAAKAAAVVIGELDRAAERYGEYSPEVAQAQAMVEIRREMNNMRRAQESGTDLARYVQAQGQLQENFEEIKIKLLMAVAPLITTMAQTLNMILEALPWAGQNNSPNDSLDPTNLVLNNVPAQQGTGENPANLVLQPNQIPGVP